MALLALVATMAVSSCGDLMDFDEPTYVGPSALSIGSQYSLTVGDSLTVRAQIAPDTISLPAIYWQSLDPTVATVNNGTVHGVGVGTARVVAMTVDTNLTDTCEIVVNERYDVPSYETYPYDMVIYARLVNAEEVDVTQEYLVTAYCGDEVRGVGELNSKYGIYYLTIRIYSPNPAGDVIKLRARGRRNATDYTFPDDIVFDGEAWGSLSMLYPFELP